MTPQTWPLARLIGPRTCLTPISLSPPHRSRRYLHQITAVYGEMLPRQPLRFLLADDPGAGKTIMAELLIMSVDSVVTSSAASSSLPGSLVEHSGGRWLKNSGWRSISRRAIKSRRLSRVTRSLNAIA